MLIIGAGTLFWFLSEDIKRKRGQDYCEEYARELNECMKDKPAINCHHENIDLHNCTQRLRSVHGKGKGLKPIEHTNL